MASMVLRWEVANKLKLDCLEASHTVIKVDYSSPCSTLFDEDGQDWWVPRSLCDPQQAHKFFLLEKSSRHDFWHLNWWIGCLQSALRRYYMMEAHLHQSLEPGQMHDGTYGISKECASNMIMTPASQSWDSWKLSKLSWILHSLHLRKLKKSKRMAPRLAEEDHLHH